MQKIKILIEESVVSLMENIALSEVKHETGGIIAGIDAKDGDTIKILKASDEGPKAKKHEYYFSRDTLYCQKVLDKWAKESEGLIDYLGEWHKHYEVDPKPSSLDIKTLKGIARSQDYHVEKSVLLIVGISANRKDLNAYIINKKGKCVKVEWCLLK